MNSDYVVIVVNRHSYRSTRPSADCVHVNFIMGGEAMSRQLDLAPITRNHSTYLSQSYFDTHRNSIQNDSTQRLIGL